MVADVAVSATLCVPIIGLAFALGIDFQAGVLGVLMFIVIAALWSLAFAGFGYAIALKTGNPAAVNSSFLLFFPFLFLTSSYVPRDQLSGWLDTVAGWNPVTYILEGLRSLALSGWHWDDLGKASLAAAGGVPHQLRAVLRRPAVPGEPDADGRRSTAETVTGRQFLSRRPARPVDPSATRIRADGRAGSAEERSDEQGSMSRLVLATADADFEQRVRDAFDGELNGPLRYWREDMLVDPDDAVRELGGRDVEVVALGPDMPEERCARARHRVRPRPTRHQRRDHRPAVDRPPAVGVPRRCPRRDRARHARRPTCGLRSSRRSTPRPTAARCSTATSDGSGDDDRGRVIMALCPKGGAGKTTVSTNLALALAQVAPGEVVILDLDVQFGDVASALGLRPDLTLRRRGALARPRSTPPASRRT